MNAPVAWSVKLAQFLAQCLEPDRQTYHAKTITNIKSAFAVSN